MSRSEFEDADRGAVDVDLDALDEAARAIAAAENAAVFHGWSAAGIEGVSGASTNKSIALGKDCERYPNHVAKAVDALRAVGVDGPYGLALGPEVHTMVLETSQHGGYPLLEHIREIVGGPIVCGARRQGRRGRQHEGWRLPFRQRAGPVDRIPEPRRRGGAALRRGELRLPGGDPRGSGPARALAPAPGRDYCSCRRPAFLLSSKRSSTPDPAARATRSPPGPRRM